jgi:Fe-S cluster assembly protein SufD
MSLATAIKTGDVSELPSRRDEDWRWTDLAGLLRQIPSRSPPGDAAAVGRGPFDDTADEEIVFLNGRALTDAGSLTVAAGASRTVALRFLSHAMRTAHAATLSVDVQAGASLLLLESYEGDGAGYVADVMLRVRLAEGARLQRIVLLDDTADAVTVSTADVQLAERSELAQTVLTDGAKRQRFETRVQHGPNAAVRLDGLYVLEAERRADLTSEVIHAYPGATTAQLAKGCVRDQARAVFQGRIIVARGADGTDARMGHHALILSERAEVDAKPELEIYADDVACSHGNTVGALDEEQLFYIRQRGVPDAQARALLTEAFVGEVVDRIEHDGARDVARAWVAKRLRSEQ